MTQLIFILAPTTPHILRPVTLKPSSEQSFLDMSAFFQVHEFIASLLQGQSMELSCTTIVQAELLLTSTMADGRLQSTKACQSM
jgi:hypothetical protein